MASGRLLEPEGRVGTVLGEDRDLVDGRRRERERQPIGLGGRFCSIATTVAELGAGTALVADPGPGVVPAWVASAGAPRDREDELALVVPLCGPDERGPVALLEPGCRLRRDGEVLDLQLLGELQVGSERRAR